MHCVAENKIARTFTKGSGIGNQSVKSHSTANLLVANLKQKFVKDAEIKKMKDRHTNQTKQMHKELTLSTKQAMVQETGKFARNFLRQRIQHDILSSGGSLSASY